MAAQYAYVMKSMTKTFPGAQKPVLSDIDLQFYQGAKIGIVGDAPFGNQAYVVLDGDAGTPSRLVPDLPRLRISSIDSIEADEALMGAIATEPRLMPHLHLSLQAGDDMILKRMKRRHLRDDAIRFCEEVVKLRPDMVFGADIIAGFPTETEAMFDNSLKLVQDCGLTFLHVFPFSPRKGTPAARMPQLDRTLIRERAAQLRDDVAAVRNAWLPGLVGQPLSILAERDGTGYSPCFARMAVPHGTPAGTIMTLTPETVTEGLLR